MSARAESILRNLKAVEAIRAAVRGDALLQAQVQRVKHYQGLRFERTYADWIAIPKATRACRFFLDELYGPKDFSERDAQFARVVHPMTKLFPDELVATVESLSALHALSEDLDCNLARTLSTDTLDAKVYRAAWCTTGRPGDRDRQVQWMHEIGRELSIYTRKPLLRHSLKLMRGPAKAAGLSDLQRFLEEGFDSFASLPDAKLFLDTVATRERALIHRLFESAGDGQDAAAHDPADPLSQLPG
jgi:hypothetical protein